MKPAETRSLDRIWAPVQRFLRLDAASGILLMGAAVLAMVIANSPLAGSYEAFLRFPLDVGSGALRIAKPLSLWINDGLMAVFFLLVGLELKREVLEGHLSSVRRASLPAIAAIGGMAGPALCYALLNRGDAVAMRGWAIPTATDIAFALGVLSLLGNRVPTPLKAFLLSVAVFDDLGAILVIAVFYTAQLSMGALVVALALVAGLWLLNRVGVRHPVYYLLLGIPLWVALLKSGVHATLAGVVLAMFIPLRPGRGAQPEAESPLHRLEHALEPWVKFGVLPLFAFANAGVPVLGLAFQDVLRPVPLGIVAGLFAGKQAGILLLCGIAVRFGLAALPEGTDWRQIHGVTLLCGIGFTMSLFIASLAFAPGDIASPGIDRLGILVGSLVSGVLGYFVLGAALGRPRRTG